MSTFARKPDTIEAIQFTGGLDSAIEVIGWLYVRNPKVAALYSPPMMNDGELIFQEHVFVDRGRGSGIRITEGYWLVLDANAAEPLYTADEDYLKAMYEKISD